MLLIITFLFWYQTWFGRELSDQDMTTYLEDTSKPHKTQHAIVQLAERMARGDAAVRQWYPRLIQLAGRPETGFRTMAAWAMGQDSHSKEFHTQLLLMLTDTEPMVRRNAALSLVRFGDASGRADLRAMLQPFPLPSPASGKVNYRFEEDEPVRHGIAVARIEVEAGDERDVIAPVSGRMGRYAVPVGTCVQAGDPVTVIAPGKDQAWEALRALYIVGTEDDLDDVERFAREAQVYPESLRRQAAATAEAIRRRATTP